MTTHSYLNQTDLEMLADASMAARTVIQIIDHVEDSWSIIDALQKHLDDLFTSGNCSPLGDNAAMAFGALFGSTICDAFGWNWIIVSHGDWEGLGVVDPEQRYLVLPLALMDEIFSTKGSLDRSPKLIFNCIKNNKLPESMPRKFVLLT